MFGKLNRESLKDFATKPFQDGSRAALRKKYGFPSLSGADCISSFFNQKWKNKNQLHWVSSNMANFRYLVKT